jgi:hypothetical protein
MALMIDDLKGSAFQHHAHLILADVVQDALDRTDHSQTLSRPGQARTVVKALASDR